MSESEAVPEYLTRCASAPAGSCSGMTDYAQGLKYDMKMSCRKGGLPMAKTQTWRGDKSRANLESTWSVEILYSLYSRKIPLSVTRRKAE